MTQRTVLSEGVSASSHELQQGHYAPFHADLASLKHVTLIVECIVRKARSKALFFVAARTRGPLKLTFAMRLLPRTLTLLAVSCLLSCVDATPARGGHKILVAFDSKDIQKDSYSKFWSSLEGGRYCTMSS